MYFNKTTFGRAIKVYYHPHLKFLKNREKKEYINNRFYNNKLKREKVETISVIDLSSESSQIKTPEALSVSPKKHKQILLTLLFSLLKWFK